MKKQTLIPIKNIPIRLSQFLKLTNIVQDGLEAKLRIQGGEISVNEKRETRRGRKLFLTDIVRIEGIEFQVTQAEE